MKTLDINELKEYPNRKLVLRHYRKDVPEIWEIDEAQVTIGNQLVIKVPETGYDTPEYVIVDDSNNEVRDTDGNLVGTVKFASEKVTLEEFADKLLRLPVDETLDFSTSDEGNDCQYGVKKIRLFDAVLIILACYGGKTSHLHDITDDENSDELYESIKWFLQSEDYIYIDLCLPIEKEMWGVTFNYEAITGDVSRKLAVTDCCDFFSSKADAEQWIADHSDGSYDSKFDKQCCSAPKAVLMDKWKEE